MKKDLYKLLLPVSKPDASRNRQRSANNEISLFNLMGGILNFYVTFCVMSKRKWGIEFFCRCDEEIENITSAILNCSGLAARETLSFIQKFIIFKEEFLKIRFYLRFCFLYLHSYFWEYRENNFRLAKEINQSEADN